VIDIDVAVQREGVTSLWIDIFINRSPVLYIINKATRF
jgi:hypothetical protein